MRKYISLFFSVCILCACHHTPPGIIKQDEMTELLTEIHIADGSLLNKSQEPDTLYKYGTGRYQYVFKRYHTDSTQFIKSYKYYAAQPEVLDSIYSQVLRNLEKQIAVINRTLSKQARQSERHVIPTVNGAAPPIVPHPGMHQVNSQNFTPAKAAVNPRLQMIRDSMARVRSKNKNAVPAE